MTEAAKLTEPHPERQPGEELNLVNLPTDVLVRLTPQRPPTARAFETPGPGSSVPATRVHSGRCRRVARTLCSSTDTVCQFEGFRLLSHGFSVRVRR